LTEPRSIAEMVGEMSREAAVLITVFVPLDVVLALYSSFGWKEIMLLVESTVIAGVALGALGIAIERRRTR
jgi:hypothetical protein